MRSPWGRVLRALREDELTTEASGKNVTAFQMQSFVLGAVIMGVGGAMYAFQVRSISPDTFTNFFGTFLIWTMVIVGGSGNNNGVLVGAYVVFGFWQSTLLIQSYDLPDGPAATSAVLPRLAAWPVHRPCASADAEGPDSRRPSCLDLGRESGEARATGATGRTVAATASRHDRGRRRVKAKRPEKFSGLFVLGESSASVANRQRTLVTPRRKSSAALLPRPG